MPMMPQFVCNMTSQNISINGVLVTITRDTMQKPCEWYADNLATQLENVLWGVSKVNSIPDFMQYVSDQYLEYKNGTFYPGLWFWQKAYFVQTGKSISLL